MKAPSDEVARSVHEISQKRNALHQIKAATARAKVHVFRTFRACVAYGFLTLCWLFTPPQAFAVAPIPAAELTGDRPATRLTQAQLDERAPLTDQETSELADGPRSLRRVYQATGLASQGGEVDPTVRHIATLAGFSVRLVQLRMRELEGRGLTRRRYHRRRREWRGPRGQNYRTYNDPNSYRFPHRERQFRFNFTPSRKNLIPKANAPKSPTCDGGGQRRTRPDDHPAELREAWEARRRANHDPATRARYEAKARFYEEMRAWRPRREASILRNAAQARLGTYYETERDEVRDYFDTAQRMGLSPRRRNRLEAQEMTWRDQVRQGWDRIEEKMMVSAERCGFTDGEVSLLKTARRECEASECERIAAELAGGVLRVELSEPVSNAEMALDLPPQRKKNFLSSEGQGSEQKAKILELSLVDQAAAISTAATVDLGGVCRRCDGKRRRVDRGRIVVCECSPGDL